jgi:uncharacterized protein YutE (UPF0331/DUF86 family)
MSKQQIGLIDVLQRIAQAIEDSNSLQYDLIVEIMDLHGLLEVVADEVIKEGIKTRNV